MVVGVGYERSDLASKPHSWKGERREIEWELEKIRCDGGALEAVGAAMVSWFFLIFLGAFLLSFI